MTILLSRFSRFVASAAVPAVWCGKRLSKKKSDLLRQESNGHGLGTHSAVLSPHPVSGVVGVATLESAGESTVTWHSQLHPDARAARTRHGDPPPWQHVAASNSPPRANVVNKQNVSSVAELQKQRDAPGSQFTPGRRVARGELDGEHGPARDQMRLAGEDPFWYEPLQREDGDSNSCNGEDHCRRGEGHKCASTSYGPATNVGHGYWFAKFADGNLHYVTTLRLWNRADNDRQYRLDGACVRFSMDGTKPSNSDPAAGDCDLKLGSISASQIGTVVDIGRWINGLMFISQADMSVFHLCGIWIFEDMSATSSTTTPTPTNATGAAASDTTVEQAGTTGVVIGVAGTLAVLGVAVALMSCGEEGPTDAAPAPGEY
eukprot:CAMPEP_0178993900 /NCGR_PEP_ID=MMETSP0795-20121207/6969_1 /TAXON_ID=88552 /ORGANISM="Amoebophrya sp., Strain Ameob2" /LENGTH=374 /DNA_ID=CAMNT_0020686029 /DNA_START=67 /DNA_END=1192 /DNA_ORIENTATION=-